MLELVEQICGMLCDCFLKIVQMIGECLVIDKVMILMYVLGWMQYFKGVQNICGMVMLQFILGNIGMCGGGMNVLCGYFNIQGLIDLGLMLNLIFGYLNILIEKELDWVIYMFSCQFKLLCLNQISYWQNYFKFMVSFMKVMWGDVVIVDNNWVYDWLFKLDVLVYDVLCMFELMNVGQIINYFCQGFNLLLFFFNWGKIMQVFSKLKLLVVMDLLEMEILYFWENYGEYNDVDLFQIQIEVLELFMISFVEDDGLLVNFGCWL